MANVSGTEVKAAIRRGAIWGTAAPCGAGHGVLLTGDTMKSTRDVLLDDSLGNAFAFEGDQGVETCAGVLSAALRYDGLDTLLALALGTPGVPVLCAGGAYESHVIPAGNIDGLFATIAINKRISLFEYASAKISGFTIKGEAGRPCAIDFDVTADHENNDGDNSNGWGANNLTTFANVTWPETGNRVLFSQLVCRLNNSNGQALADSDILPVNSFELSFKRKLKGYHTSNTWKTIDEPTNDGLPEIRLKLGLPRFNSSAMLGALRVDQRKKCELIFTGAEIAPGWARLFALSFPHLILRAADAPTAKGVIGHPLEFEALSCTAGPSGMAGILTPLRIRQINTRSISPLT